MKLIHLCLKLLESSSNDYEISFPEGHSSSIKVTTGIPDMVSFTICMWVKTSDKANAGTAFLYRTQYPAAGRMKPELAIALIDYRGLQMIASKAKT